MWRICALLPALILIAAAQAQTKPPMAGTEPLTWNDDIASRMVDGIDRFLQRDEYIVIEDGILTAMRVADSYDGGPLHAIHEFLARTGARYEIDRTLCDYFGPNVTWNVDGYLRRVR